MKSIKVTNTGGPEVLKLEDITLEKPGADEVQIEHVSIGLNYIDTYHRSGLYPLQLPTGIGMEAAGIIKEVGSNVSNFSVGDKIAYAAAPLGAYSTHRNYPSKNIVKVLMEAKQLNIKTIGFLGGTGGMALRHCDFSFVVPSDSTARIQEAHITAGHSVLQYVEDKLKQEGFLEILQE